MESGHSIQELIHRFENGEWFRHGKKILIGLVVLFLLVTYDLRCYRNLFAPEAMDAAQLARNIANGKGFTTQVVRPLSIFLVKRTNEKAGKGDDAARLKLPHPDIANPPAYPIVLAGLMKVLPFSYEVSTTAPFWSSGKKFYRYEPDFLIALFNQVLFLALIVSVFFWARRMFDAQVAWTSSALLLGTELLWRFSVSGLSTMLLLLLFMALVWCLTLWEAGTRDAVLNPRKMLGLAAAAGLVIGIGCLTRYAFGWLIIPVLIFFGFFGGVRRASVCVVTLLTFLVVIAPWAARNIAVSGLPFGTATYTVVENTVVSPEFQLQRSLNPNFASFAGFDPFWMKMTANLREVVQTDLPKLGGWVAAFFLVGLLLAFNSPALRRLRSFVLVSLVTLVVIQAAGRTQLSTETPELNTENLLVLLVPVVLVYGVSLFYVLLEQIALPLPQLRYAVVGVFGIVMCLPMFFALFFPKGSPVSYPPYHPQIIQQTANLMKENELMMSDIPWAVAWYGNRQSVWLTLNAQEDFFAVNDFMKPVQALYLTPETMDSRFLSQWYRAGEKSWGSFILDSVLKKEVPANFPLRSMPTGYWPEQLFLCDWPRWRKVE